MNLHKDDAATAVAATAEACAIRRAVVTDARMLASFGAQVFVDTYGRFNDPGNLRRHVAATFAPARQAKELEDPGVVTLLACWRSELAGFAQVRRSAAPPCVTGRSPVELYRLYVDRRWHGRGISQRILSEACGAARGLGGGTLWLKVWEHNARAIAFYRKSDFEDVGTADFFVGTDRQTDRVLVTSLAGKPEGI